MYSSVQEQQLVEQPSFAAYEVTKESIKLQLTTESVIFETSSFSLDEPRGENVEDFLAKELTHKGYQLVSDWKWACRGFYAELEKI